MDVGAGRGGSRHTSNDADLTGVFKTHKRGGGRQGRLAEYLTRMDFVVLDELGYLPFSQAGGQLLFHLISRLYERTSIIITPIWTLANGRASSATPR
jgi:DNA replication protein DnaC